jgi:hypothetical protein
LYSTLGLTSRISAPQLCQEVLIQRARGEIRCGGEKLAGARESLARFCTRLRPWVEAQQQLCAEFELLKNRVIDGGSVTLIGELDRVKAAMTSGQLGRALDRSRWDEASAFMEQIAFDLKLIRNMAEGGSDIPQSLGEACRILSVAKNTPKKTVKAVVDALRRVWHPDLAADERDREVRTIRTRQINVAWEIFRAADKSGSAPAEELGPSQEPRPPNLQ